MIPEAIFQLYKMLWEKKKKRFSPLLQSPMYACFRQVNQLWWMLLVLKRKANVLQDWKDANQKMTEGLKYPDCTSQMYGWIPFFFFFLKLFRAASVVYGSSQAGVKSELQLLAYITATATWDRSCLWDIYHSSQQRQILNPLSEARDRTCIPMDTSWICYHWATTGTSCFLFLPLKKI